MTGRPQWDAVFIDRDGTLTHPAEGRYLLDPVEVRLLPGAADAVRRLNVARIPAFMVTNQQGVASGRPTVDGLAAIHRRLAELLSEHGAHLDAMYVCPHRSGTCDCRKPRDGLLRRALQERPGIEPVRCAIVGDSDVDMAAGTPLGLFRVLLAALSPAEVVGADLVVADLAAAVDRLLE